MKCYKIKKSLGFEYDDNLELEELIWKKQFMIDLLHSCALYSLVISLVRYAYVGK